MSADALYEQASRHIQAGDYARAEAGLRQALEFDPAHAAAHGNLGYVLARLGRSEEAEAAYRRSLELNPALAEIQLNHGAVLARLKRLPEAEAAYLRAIALRPNAPAGWSNLGTCYACMQRELETEECHRKAIALDPTYAPARYNLSYLLLRQARFEEGWAAFEARDWYAPFAAQLRCPRWRGEDLAAKRVLISYEPGHGDMMFFVRYAPLLKQRGAATTTLICHPGLQTLLTGLPGIDKILPINTPLDADAYDCWTPLASLPHYSGTREGNIPARIPYLHAAPERMQAWAAQLPAGPRIGLVWKGNRHFENDADRSLPALQSLAPVLAVPGLNFISLQKGAGENENATGLLDFGPQLANFSDTAALVMNLDLVISVDTAVAHLAAALGKPCWLLLPDYKTDWRWFTNRSDSPWYPDVMRLFRQPRGGNWDPVLREVAIALSQWTANMPPAAQT
ncbi:MAG TPA: tetratricopeptide repeat protein [Burkholderiales bacterium]|nr:tetratricopeptide repeat protein [Burkholderiales bacterium]